MGTRTRVLMDYRPADDPCTGPCGLIETLAAAVPACVAVEEYWKASDLSFEREAASSWEFVERDPKGSSFLGFGRSGTLGIRFAPRVAEINTAARWRGYLTIPALREAHRAAFIAIARAVGASRIVLVPDYVMDYLAEPVDEGASIDECTTLLMRIWGPAQDNPNEVNEGVIADCDHGPPCVWYLERVLERHPDHGGTGAD